MTSRLNNNKKDICSLFMNRTCPMLCLPTVGTENTMSLCVPKSTEPDIKWTDSLLNYKIIQWDIVQFSPSVMSDSLRPHGLQHGRLPCPSPTPKAYSNSCSSSWLPSNKLILCRPLFLLPSIFPSIRVFSNESLFALDGQCIGVSASTSVLPMNTQD